MKYILPIILSIFFLFLSSSETFAYDLTVQCDRRVCNVSSKDAIFLPDQFWSPGTESVKEILISNVEGEDKDIFLDVKDANGTGELDSHILLEIEVDAEPVWGGTLADLVEEDQIHLLRLESESEVDVAITASMDERAENMLQGTSSEFDFGFGFEGDQTKPTSVDPSGGSDTIGNVAPSESVASVVGQVLTGLFTEESRIVSGTSSAKESTQRAGALGVQVTDSQCRQSNFWVIVLVTQVALGILLFFRNNTFFSSIWGHGLMSVVSCVLIYFLSCNIWPVAIAVAIFVLFSTASRHTEQIHILKDRIFSYITKKLSTK